MLLNVSARRALADDERRGNLLVGLAGSNHLQDLSLASGELRCGPLTSIGIPSRALTAPACLVSAETRPSSARPRGRSSKISARISASALRLSSPTGESSRAITS
jgi:hypothetical protein